MEAILYVCGALRRYLACISYNVLLDTFLQFRHVCSCDLKVTWFGELVYRKSHKFCFVISSSSEVCLARKFADFRDGMAKDFCELQRVEAGVTNSVQAATVRVAKRRWLSWVRT